MAKMAQDTPVHLDDAALDAYLDLAKVPVLVDAYADWCGPCRMLAPELEQVAQRTAGRLTVAKIDVDRNKRFAAKMQIRGIPAMFLFKDGQVVAQFSGYQPADAILARVEPHLPAEAPAAE